MNHSTKKLKEELFQQHLKDIDVHSYYEDKQNPTLFDHNRDFISRYDDKQAFIVKSSYNGNKYNLDRPNQNYTIHYKSKNFIPDSHYEFNLKNTDHKKMMINNLETEHEIPNDFNRRLRQSESGQSLEKIKTEDTERAKSPKLFMDEFNKEMIITPLLSEQ